MRQTYRVEVRRGDRWWVLSVPAIRAAHSQARRLREVKAAARDLIAVMLEAAADSFDVDVHVQLPAGVARRIRHVEQLREESARKQAEAAAEIREAARALHDSGVPLRDIGEVLGVFYQRVHQLVCT